MRRLSFFYFVLLTVTIFCHSAFASSPYAEDRILARFNSGLTESEMNNICRDAFDCGTHVSVQKTYTLVPGLALIDLPDGWTVYNAIAVLEVQPGVQYACADYHVEINQIPNDPRFTYQWGLNNIGQEGGVFDADIDAPEAWDTATGDGSVIVAVIDTGIDYTHPDLVDNMWVNEEELNGYDNVDDDENGYIDDIYGYRFNFDPNEILAPGADFREPKDNNYHGTHVAGIIGAVGNNGIGVSGTCWDVQLMALKAFHGQRGRGGLTSDIIEAIQYAVDMDARIINASFGGYFQSPAMEDAANTASDSGVLFVAAAGNESNNNDMNPAYPASFTATNIISVLATDANDGLAEFSNYGKSSVDIGAPGVEIMSTFPTYTTEAIWSLGYNKNYERLSGTSMAAPFVSGAAALIWSMEPDLTAQEVKDLLMNTSDPVIPEICVSGGRLNLFKAIQEAGLDELAPIPNPAEWEAIPQATGLHTISMEAVEGTDKSGVEYFFDCIEDDQFDSNSIDWQDETYYEVTNVPEGTKLTFQVYMRDKSSQQNMTEPSLPADATTDIGTDTSAPFIDPPRFSETFTQDQLLFMSAVEGRDENGPVEYRFLCLNDANFTQDWQANQYTYFRSGVPYGTYQFQIEMRDALGNTTFPSSTKTITVLPTPSELFVPTASYPTLMSALNAAQQGDTIVMYPGVYDTAPFFMLNITIRSIDPNNPDVVRDTILDFESSSLGNHSPWGIRMTADSALPCSLKGITIQNVRYDEVDRADGIFPGDNGFFGGTVQGGAIYGTAAAAPSMVELYNCIIKDCSIEGSDGGNGIEGDYKPDDDANSPNIPRGGNGGDGGDTFGAGVYVDSGDAVIKGCIIEGCQIIGADGGDGGRGVDYDPADPNKKGADGGNGGNAGVTAGGGIFINGFVNTALIEDCIIRDCILYGGQGGNGGGGGDANDFSEFVDGGHGGGVDVSVGANVGTYGGGIAVEFGAGLVTVVDCEIQNNSVFGSQGGNGGSVNNIEGVSRHGGNGGIVDPLLMPPNNPMAGVSAEVQSAYGGGIYSASPLVVEGCTISDNQVRGAVSGVGGIDPFGRREEPTAQRQIAAFGGGVYVFDPIGANHTHWFDLHDSQIMNNTFSQAGQDIGDIYFVADVNVPFAPLPYYGYGAGACVQSINLVNITETSFRNNTAPAAGGLYAFDVGVAGTPGTGLYVDDCNFSGNESQYGAGMIWSNCGLVDINDTLIRDNETTGQNFCGGAGFYGENSDLLLTNCTFADNISLGSGGGLYLIGPSNPGGQQIVENCLFGKNSADLDGGGLSVNTYAAPTISNCTFVDNDVNDITFGYGGGISCYQSFVEITNSIFWDNKAEHGSQIAVGDPLETVNPASFIWTRYTNSQGGKDAVYQGDGTTLFWDNGNIDDDPLFVQTDYANHILNYFLGQEDAGQGEDPNSDSPCVDAGDPFAAFDPNGFTTRTDYGPDTDRVDMGYHYNRGNQRKYTLTVIVKDIRSNGISFGKKGTVGIHVSGDNEINIPSTVSYSGEIFAGTPVKLTAIPENSDIYEVFDWTDLDGISLLDPNNPEELTIPMDRDKTVYLEFESIYPSLLISVEPLGQPGQIEIVDVDPNDPNLIEYNPDGYSVWQEGTVVTLRATADDGSNVILWYGDADNLWSRFPENTVTMETDAVTGKKRKNVSVKFHSPTTHYVGINSGFPEIQLAVDNADDGDIVIVPTGTYYVNEASQDLSTIFIRDKAITITSAQPMHPNETTIIGDFWLEGVGRDTIIEGFTITNTQGQAVWIQAEGPGVDGAPGVSQRGAAMELHQGASPTIINCRFVDCRVLGGDGQEGEAGLDDTGWSGNGGYPGKAYGGAVYINRNSEPYFLNCEFMNCQAIGGDGGNGVDWNPGEHPAGHGGGWGDKDAPWWFEQVQTYRVFDYSNPSNENELEEYWKYSGYGGAVFCEANTRPEFVDCNFVGNFAQGGSCGISGDGAMGGWPTRHYKIPSYGGAVYMRLGSAPTFRGCLFENNVCDANGPSIHPDGEPTYNAYPILAYGGAIAYEDDCSPVFEDCNFAGNESAVGGGLYSNESSTYLQDSIVIDNDSMHGGGIAVSKGYAEITGNLIQNNRTIEVGGAGGGILCAAAEAIIADCKIQQNNSMGLGGGVYISGNTFSGEEYLGADTVIIHNCLITQNHAAGGAGVTATWHSDPVISNCTIVDNRVMGLGGSSAGGGIYSIYGAYTSVINSILWDNIAPNGSQIAVGTSINPSTVEITYSDIQTDVSNELLIPVDANSSPVIREGFDSESLAANDDFSTGEVDIGFEIDFFGREYDSLFVNNNGNVTFDANMATFTPFALTDDTDRPIIAPFFADVDTLQGNVTQYGTGTVGGRPAFGVTWDKVGYFSQHTDKLNTFQLVIIDRSDRMEGDFDFEFNYEQIQWETGDASGGEDGFGGFSARAGFSAGIGQAGTYLELEGSGVHGAFLDDANSTGLIHNSRKSKVKGRYIFSVRKGLPEGLGIKPIHLEDEYSQVIGWEPNEVDPNIGEWYEWTMNISEDPLFVGGYYLRQILGGQLEQSPCVDAGSSDANDPLIMLDDYTTRTNGGPDEGIVDMGYHYGLDDINDTEYELTVIVDDSLLESGTFEIVATPIYNVNTNDANWSLYDQADSSLFYDPNGESFVSNTSVPLVAKLNGSFDLPNQYQVKWENTDDDNSGHWLNSVTIDAKTTVKAALVLSEVTLDLSWNDAGYVDVNTPPLRFNEDGTLTFKRGTTVELIAHPDSGQNLRSWSGTVNDDSRSLINEVLMDEDVKEVYVDFGVQTLHVPADYTSIQQAIDAAEPNDVILVSPGTYNTTWGYEIDKPVTISGVNPDEPNVVEQTLIRQLVAVGGNHQPAFRFGEGSNGAILRGLHINNFRIYGIDGAPGGGTSPDGRNGTTIKGAAIQCIGASPKIEDCVISDCWLRGGNGGNGATGGDGGWPGAARGAGIYMEEDSSGNPSNPLIVSCIFRNCEVVGGNGGDGADAPDNITPYGRGGGWHYTDMSGWDHAPDGGYMDYTRYSGLGAAAYIGVNCSPVFEECEFIGNISRGGSCGLSGISSGSGLRNEPATRWKIDNFGGAVCCDTNSTPVFTDCYFEDNNGDPNVAANNSDEHISFGGAVAVLDGAMPLFDNCEFNQNTATAGGAIYASDDSDIVVVDSKFNWNEAYNGGAICTVGIAGNLIRSEFFSNDAGTLSIYNPNDANFTATDLYGDGGAVYSSISELEISDCMFSANKSEKSGGGLYVAGDVPTRLFNCLIVDNEAVRDGGGVAAAWYADVEISNCTLSGNSAADEDSDLMHLGGGLSSMYQSYVLIDRSILFSNTADEGYQIAIGSSQAATPLPSTVEVWNSDIQGGQSDAYVDKGSDETTSDDSHLIWGSGNLPGTSASNPKFVPTNMYYLSQPDVDDDTWGGIQIALGLSPCVNAGDVDANEAGFYRHTTRTDEVPDGLVTGGLLDQDIVDLGYHYVLEWISESDFTFDGRVNDEDLLLFSVMWLRDDCGWPYWCNERDMNQDSKVDWHDYAQWAKDYGFGDANTPFVDTTPPNPDPMEWAVGGEPTSTGPSTIEMRAKDAFDFVSGSDVEYQFDCFSGGGHDRDWDADPNYTDTGLVTGQTYSYRVRARDAVGNETAWSTTLSEEAGQDDINPQPDPMTFEIPPTAVDHNTIEMTATLATDNSGTVQYYFRCVYGPGPDSGWQTDRHFVADDIFPDTLYGYTVEARDLNGNYTDPSDPNYATTPAEGTLPPLETPTILYEDSFGEAVGVNSGIFYKSNGWWTHYVVVEIDPSLPMKYYKFISDDSTYESEYLAATGLGVENLGPVPGLTGSPVRYLYRDGATLTYEVPIRSGVSAPPISWQVRVCYNDQGVGDTETSGSVTIP